MSAEDAALLRLRAMVDQLARRGGVAVHAFGEDYPTEVRLELLRWGPEPDDEWSVIRLSDLRRLIDAAAAPAEPATGT